MRLRQTVGLDQRRDAEGIPFGVLAARRAETHPRPVVAIGCVGRYVVGVPDSGVPVGRPEAPTPIRTPVAGGPPVPRRLATTFPAASRMSGPDRGSSSRRV